MPLTAALSPSHHHLLTEMRTLVPDFRVSVVAAELVANEVPVEALYFRNGGTFRRQTSKDIARVSWDADDENEAEALFVFDVNQEGIYDMMPEALVHNQASTQKNAETDHRRGVELRQQEKAARTFFGPIENEFAHRSLRLALLTREIICNDNPARTRLFFEHFFGNSTHLTDQQVNVLSYILPLCHKIRGDTSLISLAVSKIIGYETSVSCAYRCRTHSSSVAPPALGAGQLGTNIVLNDQFKTVVPVYTLNVKNIAPEDFPAFYDGGRQAQILAFITDYFFPAAATLHIQLQCSEEEKHLTTSTEAGTPRYLGFNSYL